MDVWPKLLVDLGIPATIVVFAGYLFYKYFHFKLKVMDRELERKLSDKKYSVSGKVVVQNMTDGALCDVDLLVLESIQSN